MRDLVRLADKNGGRIPSGIPVHYIKWAYGTHVIERGLNRPAVPYNVGKRGNGFILR